jgi:hypothetical protein
MNRRTFAVSTLAAGVRLAALSADDTSCLPPFSWKTVSLFNHLGKRDDDFSTSEARFLARFPLVTIEKSQAIRKGLSCEEGTVRAARQIKAINPKTRVLFYLNAVIDWPGYDARAEFERHPDWALRDKAGSPVLFRERKQFDLANPDVREWWSGVCAAMMQAAPLDGVFMDAIPKIAMQEQVNRRTFGDAKYEALESGLRELMRLTKQKIGPKRILLYNGLRGDRSRWKDGGMRYLKYADAAMIEHFGGISSMNPDGTVKKELVAADIEMIQAASAEGKMVLVKGWPAFTRSYPDTSKYPPSQDAKRSAARREIEFPLACFLVAAGPSSYFLYTWWYEMRDGALEWYPEYDKPLGAPKGPARRSGFVYDREFEHAKVRVDLEANQAKIDWIQKS